jgi:pyruvate carboxylase
MRGRCVPGVRLPELGRQHAGGHRGGAQDRDGCARRPFATRAICRIPARPSTTSKYYLKLAKELRAMGAHVLAIKDMGGLCQPRAAATLVKALKEEIGLPVHFHTHDTSGIGAASVLAAIEAGADAVDGAIDACRASPRSRTWARSSRRCASVRATPARCRQIAHDLDLLGAGAARLRRLRKRYSRRRLRGVCARHARRAVHQSARAGAILGIEDHRWPEVAQRLCAGQRDVRRHRQGDADLQGGRRHGHHHGHQRPDARGRARPGGGNRISRLGGATCFAAISASRWAAFPANCKRKMLGGKAPLLARPGELLPPADLKAQRKRRRPRWGAASRRMNSPPI